jgi:serine/threonine-protein kinase HipA
VHNEFFCMCLAKNLVIKVPNTQIKFAADMPFFVVERYDRVANQDGSMIRVHQEDFCQAMGIMPHLKYEREGGPNIKTCQEIIQKYSAFPAIDSTNFLKIVIFNYLIGNADAHGKNFSLLYTSSRPQLAPAYDLLSTAIYPELSHNMAMKIGGRYKPEEVLLRHWHRIVPDTAAARNALEKQLRFLSKKALVQAETLKLSLEKQSIRSVVFDKIIGVISDRSGRVNAGIIHKI